MRKQVRNGIIIFILLILFLFLLSLGISNEMLMIWLIIVFMIVFSYSFFKGMNEIKKSKKIFDANGYYRGFVVFIAALAIIYFVDLSNRGMIDNLTLLILFIVSILIAILLFKIIPKKCNLDGSRLVKFKEDKNYWYFKCKKNHVLKVSMKWKSASEVHGTGR